MDSSFQIGSRILRGQDRIISLSTGAKASGGMLARGQKLTNEVNKKAVAARVTKQDSGLPHSETQSDKIDFNHTTR